MADKKEYELDDPELIAIDGSEIEALVDVGIVGPDGVSRPVMINQMNEEFMQLTYEDAVRLKKFLIRAVKFLKEYRGRITQ